MNVRLRQSTLKKDTSRHQFQWRRCLLCVHTAGSESIKVARSHSFSMWAGGELRREHRGELKSGQLYGNELWCGSAATDRNVESNQIKSNQIKSLLLSHHHSTSALVSEILTSVLQTVQKKQNNNLHMDSTNLRLRGFQWTQSCKLWPRPH